MTSILNLRRFVGPLLTVALLAIGAPAAAQTCIPNAPTAPNHKAFVQRVFDAHPYINMLDEESPSGRALAVNYAAIELNKQGPINGVVNPWGRKARHRRDASDPSSGINHNTDGLTLLRPDGCFEIVDAVVGSTGRATWDIHGPFAQGANGFWSPPLPVSGAPSPVPPLPGQPPAPAPSDLSAVYARLRALENALADLRAQDVDIRAVIAAETQDIRAIIAALPSALPLYRGSLWGIGITSRPCPECR